MPGPSQIILQKALGGSEAGLRFVTFIVNTNASPIPSGSATDTDWMSCWAFETGGMSPVPTPSFSTLTPGRMQALAPGGGTVMQVGGIGQAPELSATVLPLIPEAPLTSCVT